MYGILSALLSLRFDSSLFERANWGKLVFLLFQDLFARATARISAIAKRRPQKSSFGQFNPVEGN